MIYSGPMGATLQSHNTSMQWQGNIKIGNKHSVLAVVCIRCRVSSFVLGIQEK